ncbi:aminotransferase class I/II-fold pyridoxal phosphate-dependent enzyme [Oceanobacillus polygoni]|uniref:Lysine decarboxylase n=1 Tax=Oceanobacillus polygoni TaxID=1235259 RepID=A0A9X0YTG4_9BACI|nr:aminotransferase class I/II-fold pyridoxal phosphate-dependent enzyme [Oceanobacillus polygoni]MBP2078555.1 lysine decarboxylase [Oceanobacillus polygoni]
MNHNRIPIFEKLQQFTYTDPLSFHVPGHKNGEIFPKHARSYFDSILKLDMTELHGLDDLHAPTEIIAEAEKLAADFFGSDHTFFLVGGSTAGNLAMMLATCSSGEKIIVQRNCHKSVMNGLELCGANPVFIAPDYDEAVDRYTNPSLATLKEALQKHPDAKAVVLTYPDYFGRTYPIKAMIDLAHSYNIPVLVDEAHGVHFALGKPFPASALTLGADVVVQSAHKMAPAMTMASYLHINSKLVSKERIAHYLQIIQSSSPSYPLMASLDIARFFLAQLQIDDIERILESVNKVRSILDGCDACNILSIEEQDDPLKITLHVKQSYSIQDMARLFEEENLYPELTSHNQLLLVHGLAPFEKRKQLQKIVKSVGEQLKNGPNHATIEIAKLFPEPIQELALSYQEMQARSYRSVPFDEGIEHIAAEAVIAYPPGIPIILKGERITAAHLATIRQLRNQGVRIQQRESGIKIYRK